jgi:hypothetical protein
MVVRAHCFTPLACRYSKSTVGKAGRIVEAAVGYGLVFRDDAPHIEDLVIGGPGIWVGETLIRVASRRRRKVKIHIFIRRPGIRLEKSLDVSASLELAEELEIEGQPEDSLPAR